MFCNYCGNPNPDVARFCRKCGKPTANSTQQAATATPAAVVAQPLPHPTTPDPPLPDPPLPVPPLPVPPLPDPPLPDQLAAHPPPPGPPAAHAPIPDPPAVESPLDSVPVSMPLVEAVPTPVAEPPRKPVSHEPSVAEPRMVRARSRRLIAPSAALIAVVLIGGVVYLLERDHSRTLEGRGGYIDSIAFSPDSRMIASGDSDGNVKLWDTAHGQWSHSINRFRNTDWVAFSSDGRTLAFSGASEGHGLIMWDDASGTQMRVLAEDADFVGQPVFSPDGRQLVATVGNRGGKNAELQLWDAASGSEVRRFPGYALPVFLPDGKLLAAENQSRSISLLDLASGSEVRTVGRTFKFLQKLVPSPDGRLLATAEFDNPKVSVWDVTSGNEVRTIYDSAAVRGIAFSPDSRLLATGSEDHTIKLWEVASGNQVRTLSGHSDSVNCVAFSPDGRMLASGSADGNVILWPLPQSR